MIVNGIFTSVWKSEGEIRTTCKVNTETHEVFEIESVNPADYNMECEILEYEYVEYRDENKLYHFHVYLKEDEKFNGRDDIYWRAD